MKTRETVYLARMGNQYLTALAGKDGETDTQKMRRCFSIYRYDAVQIPKAQIAKQVVKALKRDGDDSWCVERYNKISLNRSVVWTEAEG